MLRKPKKIKLNLGCGDNKIRGFINIDIEPKVKPDLVFDFLNNKLPFKNKSVDEVVLFHTIEHLPKKFHRSLLGEIWRVLKLDGRFIVSYPEFVECVDRWKSNYRGMQDFWEKTIFGRQLYPSDAHVCIMHTPHFVKVLNECGFANLKYAPEPLEKYNTVVTGTKGARYVNYEELVKRDMEKFEVREMKRSA